MASAAMSLPILTGSHSQCSKNEKPFFLGHPRSGRTNLILPRPPLPAFSVVAFARRRHTATNSTSVTPKKQKKKQNSHRKGAQEDEDLDGDAFEALFRQLEEDLKNENLSVDDFDDDISEEDLAKLEKELEEALKDDELLGALGSLEDEKTEDEPEDEEEEGEEDDNSRNAYEDHNLEEEDDEDDEDDEDEEIPIQLKNWQLKRLAYALKAGRRKTNIKNLAADLCLDRSIVLQLLRDPPPNLLMMSAALPDKPVSTVVEPVKEPLETISLEATTATRKSEANTKVPVHVMQSNWSAQKRIKKVQLETLERVYRRTKRPTNSMISSIVHVTNLPRRRVLKWFEDRRVEDGVPEHRLPYQRSSPT